MSVKVDPFVIPIPEKWIKDAELSPTVQYLWKFLYDMWSRTGGGGDFISDLIDDLQALDVRVDIAENDIDALQAADVVTDGRVTSLESRATALELADVSLDARIDALEADPGTLAASVEHDFGTYPVYDAQFTITDAAITGSSFVAVSLGAAATGRTADDWQWDGATVSAVPGSGTATCYVTFHPGPIVGPRKFNYTVI